MTEVTWRGVSRSDVGRVRDSNEDSVFTSEEAGVFVVADGMGGHAAGEVASAVASRIIGDSACRDCESVEALQVLLNDAFLEAGREIARQVEADPSRSGMGTTATALRVQPDGHFVIAHIGDSRAYLWRGGALRRVTHDHSWVQEQVDRGLITPEQAIGHPQSNIITRALGTDPRPTPDLFVGDCVDGDVFVLATDGLTDRVREDRLAGVLAALPPKSSGSSGRGGAADLESAADALVREANENGGTDNITVLLVRVTEL